MRHLAVQGKRLAFRESGTGPALVLLHGIGSSSLSWQYQLESLSADRRVIAWDMPGYGESEFVPLDEASDYARLLGEFLDVAGVGNCDLVGHSLGALIAASFARLQPHRVRRLILVDPAIGHGSLPAAESAARLAARLGTLRELGPVGLAEWRAASLVSSSVAPQILEKVKAAMRTVRAEGYEQASYMLSRADIFADLAAIDCPVLVIQGEDDSAVPIKNARAVAERAAAKAFHVLPGIGHQPHVEDPARLNQFLAHFLN
jgi:pimeloyl-ACP methyl ester carboxylesterase